MRARLAGGWGCLTVGAVLIEGTSVLWPEALTAATLIAVGLFALGLWTLKAK